MPLKHCSKSKTLHIRALIYELPHTPLPTTYNFNHFVPHYFYSQINYLGFDAALSETHNLR